MIIMIVHNGREGGREGGRGEGKSGYNEWCLASLFNELIPALYSLIIDDTSSLLT